MSRRGGCGVVLNDLDARVALSLRDLICSFYFHQLNP